MISSFGQRFSPDKLCGRRAKEYIKREAQFQQLIGDALREVHGAAAEVFKTPGRDGSIDAWVECPVSGCGLLGELPGPILIECKDHETDTDWTKTKGRIDAGWRTVRAHLQAQAPSDLQGMYKRWHRAHSYVYCISATFPNPDSKDEFSETIRRYLKTIVPQITNVVVCDWGTLSFWLNKHRHVVDNWLGIGHPAIKEHLEYIKSLTGFNQYLLNENLAYQAPYVRTDTHPEVLWEYLSKDSGDRQPGLILYGPGGVGKTRLCLEVATRANEQGWRVLHLGRTNEENDEENESLTERDLTSVIVDDNRPTLLCLDYIDQMQSADYLLKGTRLVGYAANYGTRLRYLANSRPRWAQKAMRKGDAVKTFSFRELRLTDKQEKQLLYGMAKSVAPRALEKWGYQKLRRACGRRPIIALYIAREIENRFVNDKLDQNGLLAMARGDLSAWLRRRLAQDDIKIMEPISELEAGAPARVMVAACGAFVAAPNNSETLVGATTAVLQTLGARPDGGTVVDRLIDMGWLESHGPWLATPHDAVTDEVLDQVARDKNVIRMDSLEAVMSLWKCEPAAIGRLASALQRWVGTIPEDCQLAAKKAKDASVNWLRTNAGKIGNLLVTGDSDRTSYALGAMLRWPPWSAAVADSWDELLTPWIKEHGGSPGARHLLYIGLSEGLPAQRLFILAIDWLKANPEEPGASYVLGPLLERSDLQDTQLDVVIGGALRWISKYRLEKDAQYVLHPLLGRRELEEKKLEEVFDRTLGWLAKYQSEQNAQYVIRALLRRKELKGNKLEAAIRRALGWLVAHPSEKEAQVGNYLNLRRHDLLREQQENTIRHAFDLLTKYPPEEKAGYVLPWILKMRGLNTEESEEGIRQALKWLEQYPLEMNAQIVLRPLLKRKELQGEKLKVSICRALDWLIAHPSEKKAQFVHYLLLKRHDLQGEQQEDAIRHAFDLLVKYPLEEKAGYVLPWILIIKELRKEQSEEVIHRAIKWLEVYSSARNAGDVLSWLLGKEVLQKEELGKLVGQALTWLSIYSSEKENYMLLFRALHHENTSDADWLPAAQVAFEWLGAGDRSSKEKDYIVHGLLKRPTILSCNDLQTAVRAELELYSIQTPDNREFIRKRLIQAIAHLPEDDPLAREVMTSLG